MKILGSQQYIMHLFYDLERRFAAHKSQLHRTSLKKCSYGRIAGRDAFFDYIVHDVLD